MDIKEVKPGFVGVVTGIDICRPLYADEVAAIVAAVTALEAERQAFYAAQAASFGTPSTTSAWVDASRRHARSVAATRGSWRLSGRMPRRSR